ncbi:hypothetical protein [Thiolapillus sp.]|uniref:hypothetical protein n=1 Tax=Thiolapillus sp. TaxID=2017437 RepID=UPI003AF96F41
MTVVSTDILDKFLLARHFEADVDEKTSATEQQPSLQPTALTMTVWLEKAWRKNVSYTVLCL